MKEVYTLNLREGELLSFNGNKRGYALAENITSVGMCLPRGNCNTTPSMGVYDNPLNGAAFSTNLHNEMEHGYL